MNFKPSLLTFSILAGSVHCFPTGSIKQSKKVIFQQRLETKFSAHDKTEQLCNDDNDVSFVEFNRARRSLICNIGATMVGGIVSFANNDPAFALVEGYAPPRRIRGRLFLRNIVKVLQHLLILMIMPWFQLKHM